MRQLFLVIYAGETLDRVVEVNSAVNRIGRRSGIDINLQYYSIRRLEAEILQDNSNWVIRPKFGTCKLLNGDRIYEDELLSDGDDIQIGGIRLHVCFGLEAVFKSLSDHLDSIRTDIDPAMCNEGFAQQFSRLTTNERRVFELLAEGTTEENVATRIGIGFDELHVLAKSIFDALSASTN